MRLLLITLAALLQTPQPQQQAQQAPATVEGRVVKYGTGEPLADVTVELQRTSPQTGPPNAGPPPIPPVKTDVSGRFQIANIAPDEYRLYATHSNGYVPAEYGQRIPTGIGIPFTLTAGQSMTGITLSMVQTATISGRVTDANNDPVVFASVLVFRFVYRESVRTVEIVQSALTNDRGEYRAYWLAPGKYYLSALPIGQRQYNLALAFPSRVGGAVYVGNPLIAVRSSDTGEVFEETYLPMYYPGSSDVRSAQPIMLQPNDNLKIDMSVAKSPARTLQVNGTLFDASGKPFAGARVTMAARKQEGHSVLLPTGTADANGMFSLHGVTAGSYTLFVVQDPPRSSVPLPAAVAPTSALTASIPIDVGTSNIENLKIQTAPTANLEWQIAYEPRNSTDQAPRFSVSLKREPDYAGAPPVQSNFGPAAPVFPFADPQAARPPGPTVLEGVNAGDFRVVVSPIPRTGYLKSIRWGNIDVLKDGLHINGPTRNALEIVVSGNGGTMDGTILDGITRQPFPNATVALLPTILQRQRLDLFKTTSSGNDGKFHIEGIAPGEYKVFAWEAIQQGDWYDPDAMRDYESRGVTAQIEEGKSKTVEVTAIPARNP